MKGKFRLIVSEWGGALGYIVLNLSGFIRRWRDQQRQMAMLCLSYHEDVTLPWDSAITRCNPSTLTSRSMCSNKLLLTKTYPVCYLAIGNRKQTHNLCSSQLSKVDQGTLKTWIWTRSIPHCQRRCPLGNPILFL